LSDLQEFLNQFLEATEYLQRHMLDVNLLYLSPENIFWKENTYFFCYLPVVGVSLLEQFRRLTEFFVKQIDYHDMECVFLAHKLNQQSMEDQYDIRSILDEYEREAKARSGTTLTRKEPFRHSEETNPVSNHLEDSGRLIYEDASSIHERIGPREWMVRKIRRFRKEKWGNWQDLILESDRQETDRIL